MTSSCEKKMLRKWRRPIENLFSVFTPFCYYDNKWLIFNFLPHVLLTSSAKKWEENNEPIEAYCSVMALFPTMAIRDQFLIPIQLWIIKEVEGPHWRALECWRFVWRPLGKFLNLRSCKNVRNRHICVFVLLRDR